MKNLRTMLSPDVLLIHLGDVSFGKRSASGEFWGSLPGKKWLVRGNHDHESDSWYLTHGWDAVVQSMVFRNVLLTHVPANKLPANAVLNVHGHLHGNGHRSEYQLKPFHKLLAIENTNYMPVSWEKFVGSPSLIQL